MTAFTTSQLPPSEVAYSESEIRVLAGILGTAIAIPSGNNGKKQFILTELARVIRADAWAWTLHDVQASESPLLIDSMKVGIRGNRFGCYQKSLASEYRGKAEHFQKGKIKDHFSCSEIGLGSNLVLSVFLKPWTRSTIAFFRKPPGEAFSEREIAISALLLTEIPWLHEQDFPRSLAKGAKDLPRRIVQVLGLLLKGHSRKEIGSILGIQLNTVHGYVRFLFSHFGVSSHSALLQQCLHEGLRPTPRE